LAGLYTAQGRYADAEPLYRRSLALDREKNEFIGEAGTTRWYLLRR